MSNLIRLLQPIRSALQVCIAIAIPTTAWSTPQEVDVPCGAAQAPMCFGERALCSISPASNIDVYQFAGTAGDRVRVTIAGNTGNLGPTFEIYEPSGTPLLPPQGCSPCNNCACSLRRTIDLTASGVHSLLVYDGGLNNTGNYALDLQRLPPLGPVPSIDYGQSKNVSIDHGSDHDWFTFEAAVGTQVRISASGLTGNLGPQVEVFDTAGLVLASTSCSPCSNCVCSPTPITFVPPDDGTYYIAVSDLGNNNTGSISLSLSCIVGTCPPPAPFPSIGTSYCAVTPNSVGSGAVLSAFGSDSVGANDVRFLVTDVPSAKAGIVFFGMDQTNLFLAGSWGPLCVRPPVTRRPLVFTCNSDSLVYRLDLSDPLVSTMIAGGDRRYFQVWFRDPAGTPPRTTNTSDAVWIDFVP